MEYGYYYIINDLETHLLIPSSVSQQNAADLRKEANYKEANWKRKQAELKNPKVRHSSSQKSRSLKLRGCLNKL